MNGQRARRILHIVPRVGVPPLRFGMTAPEVKKLLGAPDDLWPVWYYFESSLQLNFSDNAELEAIEISWAPALFAVHYGEISVFDLPAAELVSVLAREAAPVWEREDTDSEDTVYFPDLDLIFWRPTVPSSYDPDDPEDEYRNGRYWLTVSLSPEGGVKRRITAANGSQ